ncbi:MAG: methylmalonyl-CoA mutase family protein [Nocardioides sp.]|uniref:methylmalonyl-CoA mutase family protein n=1 Tax=Nocardioides sp. TaxID=35761 RepID=UPI003F0B2730
MTDPTPEAPVQRIDLASDQDVATVTDWEKATADVLRKSRRLGDDDADSLVWERLARTTLDDISVAPIGQRSDLDGLTTAGRPARDGDWDNRPPLAGDDAKALNEAALVDLENGATSLFLDLDGNVDLEVALKGVFLDLAPVTLRRPTPEQSAALADVLAERPDAPHPDNNLSADPVTAEVFGHAGTGATPDEAFAGTAARAKALGIRGVVVDGTVLHDRGASDAQELGWTMAVGAHYLRLLTEAGHSLDESAALIEFRYSATDEQFPTIAKFRAARRLWARVLELSGGSDVPQHQHAVTSSPMMTTFDPYVNMLRTTVAAFAAGVGGADAVTVLPFDARLGRSDAFGRRIARNTSSLLTAESHLGKVTDPAGGSYAVEKLTDDLAVVAWAEFTQIEAEGTIASDEALAALKVRVNAVRDRRDQQVADRSRPVTGVSEFPNLGETLPTREGTGLAAGAVSYAWAYEDLRREPAAQPVFLATLGPVAAHTARATFATNLFAAGGVSVTSAGATTGVEDLLAAHAGEKVACLAGTDAAYAEWGAEAVAALRDAGVTRVILAGKPKDLAVDDSCATGLDALAFLNRTREALA